MRNLRSLTLDTNLQASQAEIMRETLDNLPMLKRLQLADDVSKAVLDAMSCVPIPTTHRMIQLEVRRLRLYQAEVEDNERLRERSLAPRQMLLQRMRGWQEQLQANETAGENEANT